ncbi:MFS general substrate transporter [Agrocybe pediades]|nr:MFS general substrate transporter [Agrocybe pediades]
MDSSRALKRVALLRGVALLCACSLSIGSHFGLNSLGPLKSKLSREKGTSSSQFGLLTAASALNSTWTPLVGGLLAARLGTSLSSIMATSIIFAGQLILLFGDLTGSVRIMVFGMFIFGLGVSPLAVVQETIIVRHFKDHGLGLSLALGLVAGKFASFVASRISFPLSQWNEHAPFFVSACLAGFSFCVNLFYLWYSKWMASELDRSSGISDDDALHEVSEKRKVRIGDLLNMGDVFWLYIAINVFCGFIWTPFFPIAPNIIERRYGLSEGRAAEESSLLHAGSMFLYPLCGYLTDVVKKRSFVHRLLLLSSVLTMFCYGWLSLSPTTTKTPLPAMISFGFGLGFSPLLLVIIVPHLVPTKYVSTALGAHKSIESSGSTMMQTLAGLALDSEKRTQAKSIEKVLNAFLTLNIIQFFGVYIMMVFDRRRRQRLLSQMPEAIQESENEALTAGAGDTERPGELHRLNSSPIVGSRMRRAVKEEELLVTASERMRGKVFLTLSAMLILWTWMLFMICTLLEFPGTKP